LNWLAEPLSRKGRLVQVKLRSAQQPVEARIFTHGQGQAELHLTEPGYGISPGQAAVCYDGSRILGGGWITRTDRSQLPAEERLSALDRRSWEEGLNYWPHGPRCAHDLPPPL